MDNKELKALKARLEAKPKTEKTDKILKQIEEKLTNKDVLK